MDPLSAVGVWALSLVGIAALVCAARVAGAVDDLRRDDDRKRQRRYFARKHKVTAVTKAAAIGLWATAAMLAATAASAETNDGRWAVQMVTDSGVCDKSYKY